FSNFLSLTHIAGSANNFSPLSDHLLGYIGFWLSALISTQPSFSIPLIVGTNFYISFAAILVLFGIIFKYNFHHLKPQPINLVTSIFVKRTMLYWLIIPSIVLLLPIGALAGVRIYYYFL